MKDDVFKPCEAASELESEGLSGSGLLVREECEATLELAQVPSAT
jgi:hypothetical protein